MKQIRQLMGMPIIVEIVDASAAAEAFDEIYEYFTYVDQTFSTFKDTSEIMQINRGELKVEDACPDVQLIFALAEQTRQETNGYFNISFNGRIDPAGIVKGWAIYNAADLLRDMGFENYYVDAGGDIQAAGHNADGKMWRVGIRNPFSVQQIVKAVYLYGCGIATSGTYLRGDHIYNPKKPSDQLDEIVSLTVIGPDVYEADRFATAAFAMGAEGINFIQRLEGFEGYQIDRRGIATMTTGFSRFTEPPTSESDAP